MTAADDGYYQPDPDYRRDYITKNPHCLKAYQSEHHSLLRDQKAGRNQQSRDNQRKTNSVRALIKCLGQILEMFMVNANL
jgi:hypothetical protein